ncbi:MAG: FkbM family methyltransferase [Candidatus Melainabacteria bacterium]|nr:FkbM family methyltransferase [Candidatus Melainabacteria bacterium]
MSMQRVGLYQKMTQYLVASEVFADDPLMVADIGASGGVEQHWKIYDNQFRVLGFEPDKRAYQRLIEEENNSNIEYFPLALHRDCSKRKFFLGKYIGGSFLLNENEYIDNNWSRVSAVALEELEQVDNQPLDQGAGCIGHAGAMEIETVSLDSFCADRGIDHIDFLKIDTDGSDLDVLLGGKVTLVHRNVLGVCVEVAFSNQRFCQIDSLLQELGFSLFDLDVYRYSRKDLPFPFVLRMPAQTVEGQIIWGNALYFKDLANSRRKSAATPETALRILKLASLYELYGLPDCAAELINVFKAELCAIVDCDALLDLLTPPLCGQTVTYSEYLRAFRKTPELFFPPSPAADTLSSSEQPCQTKITGKPSLMTRLRIGTKFILGRYGGL